MTTDLYKTHNQSDGEGIVYSDLNDMARFVRAQLFDQILEGVIGDLGTAGADPSMGGARGQNAPAHLAYAIHGGAAYLRQGSANNKLQIAPGTLLQKVANSDGNDATLIAYTFAGTEEVAIAAGSGTNPRVDLVQMQLAYAFADSQTRNFKDAVSGALTTTATNKKRAVTCTLSVKQGTPAASPTVPDPDAGYVAVATVVVGTSYATGTALIFGIDTAGNNAVVHDQRMPIGTQGIHSSPAQWDISQWPRAQGGAAATNNATNLLFLFANHPGNGCSRLVFVGGNKDATGSFGATAFQVVANALDQVLGGVMTSMNNIATSAARYINNPYYTIDAAHAPAAGPTIVASTTNKIGAPVWSSGSRCAKPLAAFLGASSPIETAFRIQNAPNGSAQLMALYTIWASGL